MFKRVTNFILKNGFEIIEATDKTKPFVSVQFYVRMGSNRENTNEAGFSHFTEHLVFKSTKKFPKNSIMQSITSVGGEINAYTEYDSTCYYINIQANYLELALESLSQLAFYANFSDLDFNVEKDVVIQELIQYENDIQDNIIKEVCKNYFKKSAYKNPIIGNLKNLLKASPKDLRTFYKKHYTPFNSFLVISGNIQLSKKIISSYFINQKSNFFNYTCKLPKNFEQHSANYKFLPFDIKNDILTLVFAAPKNNNLDSVAYSIAIKILAEEKNSVLYKSLFLNKKLISNLSTIHLRGIKNGITLIEFIPKKVKINKLINEIKNEISNFVKFNLNRTDFEITKNIIKHNYNYSFEDTETFGFTLGNEHIMGSYKNYLNFLDVLKKVTFKDVERVVKNYFTKLVFYHCGNKKIKFKKRINKPLFKKNNLFIKSSKRYKTVGISLSVLSSCANENVNSFGINEITSLLTAYDNNYKNHQQLQEFFLANGIKFSINTNLFCTSFNLQTFPEKLFETLVLLKEIFYSPIFPTHHLKNVLSATINTLKREKDEPLYYSDIVFKKMLLGPDSNLIRKNGKISTLNQISKKSVINWHKNFFLKNKKVLVIVGDVDREKTVDFCSNLFDLEDKQIKKSNPLIKSSKKKIQYKTLGLKKQKIMHIGGFSSVLNKKTIKKNISFNLLSQIIGGDITSRMFNLLREEMGVCYSANFVNVSSPHLGYFFAKAIIKEKEEKAVLNGMDSIFENIKKKGVLPEELDSAKTNTIFKYKRLKEYPVSVAFTIAMNLILGFDYNHYKNFEQRVLNVDNIMVKKVANEYLKNYFINISK